MSDRWVPARREAFVRDFVRDYCQVFLILAEQAWRFEHDGSMSYSGLRELMGEAMRKGVFWRLKDTAHYLFRNEESVQQDNSAESYTNIGRLIDWCIGYAFHECCKLREDAFQGQHYATRLVQLSCENPLTMRLSAPLMPLAGQTAESVKREITRILHVLRAGMLLLIRFLPSASENCSLARWLATDEERARKTFQNLYPALLKALYKNNPERMYTLAAVDFLDCGRTSEAMALLEHARGIGSLDEDGVRLEDALRARAEATSAQKGR